MSKMITVNVLRSVRIAAAGTVYGREIVAGTTDEVPEDLLEGLRAGGWVEEGAPAPVEPASEAHASAAVEPDDQPPAESSAKSKTPARRK